MPLHPFNLYWNTSTGHALTSLWSYTSTPHLYLVAPLKIISERHTSSYESTNASLLGILSSFWTTSLPPMELGLTKGIYKLLLYSWPQPKLKRFVPSLAYVTTIDDLSRTIRFLLDRYPNYWRKKLYFTGTPHNTYHLWLWKKDSRQDPFWPTRTFLSRLHCIPTLVEIVLDLISLWYNMVNKEPLIMVRETFQTVRKSTSPQNEKRFQ